MARRRSGSRLIRRLIGAAGEKYLLCDEFNGTLAAGAVNGTLATDGHSVRVVGADTNSKLSIGSGVLSNATGGLNEEDPRMYYEARTRAAGLLLVTEVNIAEEGLRVGFSDATNTLRQSGVRFQVTDLQVDSGNGAYNLVVATYTMGATHQIAIVLRAAGEYVFIKGGAFTTWTLVWVDPNGATATLYPMITEDDSISVWTSSFIRIPAPLWLPTPLCYDSFTRANGALGSSETTGPDGALQPCQARTWNNRVGTTQIATNKASASALVGGLAIATVDTGVTNVVMQGTLTSAGNEVGLVLRYADADNYVRAIHDGTNMKLIKRLATVETDVISAAVAIGAGAVQVIADGTSFDLFLNNAKVGATGTISDAALQTGTEQGLFSTNVGNTQDAFLVMPRTGGNYGDLNRWSGVNP